MGPAWGRAAAGTRGTVGHCLDLAFTFIEGEKAKVTSKEGTVKGQDSVRMRYSTHGQ